MNVVTVAETVAKCVARAQSMTYDELVKVIGQKEADLLYNKHKRRKGQSARVHLFKCCEQPLEVFEKILEYMTVSDDDYVNPFGNFETVIREMDEKGDSDSEEKYVSEEKCMPIFDVNMNRQVRVTIPRVTEQQKKNIRNMMEAFWNTEDLFVANVNNFDGEVRGYRKHIAKHVDDYRSEIDHIQTTLQMAIDKDEHYSINLMSNTRLLEHIVFRGRSMYDRLIETPNLIQFVEY